MHYLNTRAFVEKVDSLHMCKFGFSELWLFKRFTAFGRGGGGGGSGGVFLKIEK